MSNVIQLDENGLQAFVQESIRQILTANRAVECELGVTIQPRFKIAFSGLVVAKGGLNSVERATTSSNEPQIGESIDEAAVERSTREGSQNSEGSEKSKVTALERQDSGNTEDGTTHTKASNHEEGVTTSKGTESGTNSGSSTTSSDAISKETNKSQQQQANGTTSTTTTDYSQ